MAIRGQFLNSFNGMQMTHVAMELYNRFQLQPSERNALSERWASWSRRRAAVSRKLASAVATLEKPMLQHGAARAQLDLLVAHGCNLGGGVGAAAHAGDVVLATQDQTADVTGAVPADDHTHASDACIDIAAEGEKERRSSGGGNGRWGQDDGVSAASELSVVNVFHAAEQLFLHPGYLRVQLVCPAPSGPDGSEANDRGSDHGPEGGGEAQHTPASAAAAAPKALAPSETTSKPPMDICTMEEDKALLPGQNIPGKGDLQDGAAAAAALACCQPDPGRTEPAGGMMTAPSPPLLPDAEAAHTVLSDLPPQPVRPLQSPPGADARTPGDLSLIHISEPTRPY